MGGLIVYFGGGGQTFLLENLGGRTFYLEMLGVVKLFI